MCDCKQSHGDSLLVENDTLKLFRSPEYNYNFSKVSGYFERYGKNKDEDPDYAPFSEIVDIEISSSSPEDIVEHPLNIITEGGCSGVGCKKYCYKGSTANKTIHMSLELLKKILDRLHPATTQIAYGICSIDSHPQLWDILQETRNRGIIPNLTVNAVGITEKVAEKLSKVLGACAVSINQYNKEIGYTAISNLTKYMNQINIHIVLAEDTVDFIKSVVDDIKTDLRLSKLNALVMLSFKDKNKTGCFSPITLESAKELIEYCDGQPIGFDSCFSHTYLEAIKDNPNFKQLEKYVDKCESMLMSLYCNVFGTLYACSFCEGIGEWKDGIPILEYNNWEDIWYHPIIRNWRNKLLANDRRCPYYTIG